MARSLASKPNVIAPGGNYPYGRIRDDDGTGNGTPVNELVYGDFHQFFARLMALAAVTPNDFPENNADGFQLITALSTYIQSVINSNKRIRTIARVDTFGGSGILYQSGSVISVGSDVLDSITVTHNIGNTNYVPMVTTVRTGSSTDPIGVADIQNNSFRIVALPGAGRGVSCLSILV